MARQRELPPVPEKPVVSPAATVGGEEEIEIDSTSVAPRLEARVRAPRGATRAVLLCHPHPLYGGTMHSAVLVAVARLLAERGGDDVAHLRFNYRGVGRSEGAYDEGRGEIRDTTRALAELSRRAPGARITVCGYSFGTWVGLRAAAAGAPENGVDRVVLVAPAVRVFDFLEEDGRAFPGRIAIFAGDQDDFCEVEEAKGLATRLGATLEVLPGSDHFFLRSRRALAEAAYPAIVPR